MADVSKIFKPRRGTASIMAGTKKSTVLASGELFVEVPNTGVGTGASKIKIGDGTTAYSSLPYALGDTSNDKINFSSNTSTTVAAALNSVVTGASLKNIVAGLKQAISLCNTSITQLNDDTSKIKTYVGEDGQIHFTDVTGADSVLPFSKGTEYRIISGNITNLKLLTWIPIELGFRPRMLRVHVWQRPSGETTVSYSVNWSWDEIFQSLDTRYCQITSTGFKIYITEQSYINANKIKYIACG